MDGDPEWAAQAREALEASMDMRIFLEDERFTRLMKEKGAPDEVIRQFIDSWAVVDESWLGGPGRSYSY